MYNLLESKSAQNLIDISFQKIGFWQFEEGQIIPKFEEEFHIDCNINNVLYAFTYEDDKGMEYIRYIGKTTRTLNQRMYEYANPGKGQKTNLRINNELLKSSKENKTVCIYMFKDIIPLNWGGFNLNVAAGLEDSLVYNINPDWNKHGKNTLTSTEETELEVSTINLKVAKQLELVIKLGSTYYKKGFFNLKKEISQYIDKSLSTAELILEGGPVLSAKIDRTTNPDNTIRLYYGNELINWISENYSLGDSIVSLISIKQNKVIIKFNK